MNEQDEQWTLTEAGIEAIVRIDELFRTTDYSHDRIAVEVGLSDSLHVQILYAMGIEIGLIDAIQEVSDEV